MKAEENLQPGIQETGSLKTEFKNPPTIAELESDFTAAESFQTMHIAKLTAWLDNLYCTGSAAIKKRRGRS